MKLLHFNPETNRVVIEIRGCPVDRDLDTLISTGQTEELSESDRAILCVQLEGHPRIVADEGLAGGHSFSLPGQKALRLLLCGLYLALLVYCPNILPGHTHRLGVELSLASVLLALSFPLLDSVRELYGKRRAQWLRRLAVVILLAIAGFYWLQLNYLSAFVSASHEGTGHGHNLTDMNDFYHEFPETYVLLALTLWIADAINTRVFDKLGTLKTGTLIKSAGLFHGFAVRSVLSSLLAQLVFMPLAAFLLKTAFWHDAHFFSFILDISLWKLLLVLVCQSVALVIVYGTRKWRRIYVTGIKIGSRRGFAADQKD